MASDNQVYCWGSNSYGQLGNDYMAYSTTPVVVDMSGVLPDQTIKQIATGGGHTCALASDNWAYCWGLNVNGQLGNDDITNSPIPVAVDDLGVLSGKTIKQIVSHGDHTCAIASDDLAYCWGYNSDGQVGDGNTFDSPAPAAVYTGGVLNNKTIKQISAGIRHTCAIASDDLAYCWGTNEEGQLGNNSILLNSPTPVAIYTGGALSSKTIKQISAGLRHICAVASDDQIYCWGWNGSGQFGNGSVSPGSSVPMAVDTNGALNGKVMKLVSSGLDHTCATTSDDQTYCWGYNGFGQLGDGSTDDSLVPVAVDTSSLPVVPNVQSILFGAVPAASFVIDSATQLTAITPAHPAGLVDVTLFNAKNQPVVLVNGYEFMAPSKPSAPQTPGAGVGNNKEAIIALVSLVLVMTGLSLIVYRQANQKPKWFKE